MSGDSAVTGGASVSEVRSSRLDVHTLFAASDPSGVRRTWVDCKDRSVLERAACVSLLSASGVGQREPVWTEGAGQTL